MTAGHESDAQGGEPLAPHPGDTPGAGVPADGAAAPSADGDPAAPADGGPVPGATADSAPPADGAQPEVDGEVGGASDSAGGAGSDDTGSAEADPAQVALAERTADLQRLQAEFVNYKRRVERDRELVKQNATFTALTGLLPVLDDIDRAREHGEVEGGFKAVADSLDRAVAGLGLTKFGAPGDEFDPNLHEALMHGHSPEVTTTTVEKVVQAGYRIGERVVRAARVTVLDPEG